MKGTGGLIGLTGRREPGETVGTGLATAAVATAEVGAAEAEADAAETTKDAGAADLQAEGTAVGATATRDEPSCVAVEASPEDCDATLENFEKSIL